MSGQEMTFQLAYSSPDSPVKCKSCQSGVEPDTVLIGVKSESMYDPMWYHLACFWTRCPYRRQMQRHSQDYTQLQGYASLALRDKNSFKDALKDLAEFSSARMTTRSKRPSESDDNPADVKKMKGSKEQGMKIGLPKLALSATELLVSRPNKTISCGQTGNKSHPQNVSVKSSSEKEIHVSEDVTVKIRNLDDEKPMVDIMLNSNGGDPSFLSFTERNWKKMVSIQGEVSKAVMCPGQHHQVFPITDSRQISVTSNDDGTTTFVSFKADIDSSMSLDEDKSLTLTSDQWLALTSHLANIDA